MVWVRRLIVLVVIAAAYFGYTWVHDWNKARRAREEDRTALVTAEVWVATARFHNDQDRFIAYRDSLLSAEGITRDQLYKFLDRYEHKEEQFLDFTKKVKVYVDSLARLADSTRNAKFAPPDSTKVSAPDSTKKG